MIQIVLCEEDKKLAAQMEYFFQMNSTKISFTWIPTGEGLVEQVNNGAKYDIYIIGNMLQRFNGISVAKKLRDLGVTSDIMFISGVDYYFYDAFEVEAFRFMKKPIDWKAFRLCIQKMIDRIHRNHKYFYFKKDNTVHKIALSDILYFESCRRTINIITNHGIYSYYDRLDLVEQFIRERNCYFIRIHKSYLVNVEHISEYEYSKMHLVNEQSLPISENKRITIRNEYYNYIDGCICGTLRSKN